MSVLSYSQRACSVYTHMTHTHMTQGKQHTWHTHNTTHITHITHTWFIERVTWFQDTLMTLTICVQVFWDALSWRISFDVDNWIQKIQRLNDTFIWGGREKRGDEDINTYLNHMFFHSPPAIPLFISKVIFREVLSELVQSSNCYDYSLTSWSAHKIQDLNITGSLTK